MVAYINQTIEIPTICYNHKGLHGIHCLCNSKKQSKRHLEVELHCSKHLWVGCVATPGFWKKHPRPSP